MANTITEKQKYAIRLIESFGKIKYTGNSKADAWKFINDNIEIYKKAKYIVNEQDANDMFYCMEMLIEQPF